MGYLLPRTASVVLLLVLHHTAAHIPIHNSQYAILAGGAIFGIGTNDSKRPPPPPPPPPQPLKESDNPQSGEAILQQHHHDVKDNKSLLPPPPPPPLQSLASTTNRTTTESIQQQEAYTEDAWADWYENGSSNSNNNDQQQQQVYYDQQQYNDMWMLQQDLEAALYREYELGQQLTNLTSSFASLQQREELQLRQLDVLTERIVQVEAEVASKTNAMLEYQANCSSLGQQMAELNNEVVEYKAKCADWEAKNSENESRVKELKRELQDALMEAEELAAMIERHHIHEDLQMTRRSSSSSSSKRGLFGWLFGWKSTSESEDIDEVLEAGRSTLLKALQTERSNVEELEVMVSTLQSNNTAIAEQVLSRDTIIDELNDRVAVFEEDKLVLKAALRQLQKELKEEAPKTAKLIKDLDATEKLVAELQANIDKQKKEHKKQVKRLEGVIALKQEAISALQSNMTIIGNYVDKLEERLADFALAKRDIATREEQFNKTENTLSLVEDERRKLSERIEQYAAEHDDLKKLLKELSFDRSRLSHDKEVMAKELNGTKAEVTKLEKVADRLRNEAYVLRKSKDEFAEQVKNLEAKLLTANRDNARLHGLYNQAKTNLTALSSTVQDSQNSKDQLEKALQEYETAKSALQNELEQVRASAAASETQWKAREQELSSALDNTKKDKKHVLLDRSNEVTTLKNKISEQQDVIASLQQAIQQREVLLKESRAQKTVIEPKRSVKMQLDVQPDIDESKLELSVPELSKNASHTEDLGLPYNLSLTSEHEPADNATHKQRDKAGSHTEDLPYNLSLTSEHETADNTTHLNNHKADMQANATRPFGMRDTAKRHWDMNATNLNATNVPGRPLDGRIQCNATTNALPTNRTLRPLKRNVPFRKVRKFFAKTTGIHGAFTPPSRRPKFVKGQLPPRGRPKGGMPPKGALPRPLPKGAVPRNGPLPKGAPKSSLPGPKSTLPSSNSLPVARATTAQPGPKAVKVVTRTEQKVTRRYTFFKNPFANRNASSKDQ